MASATASNADDFTPSCVRRLLQSTEYAELEEACADVAYFALNPKNSGILTKPAVWRRLIEIGIFMSSHGAAAPSGESPTAEPPHRGILYLQIAALEAVRNLISRCPDSGAIVDDITAAAFTDGATLADGFVSLLGATWAAVQLARSSMTAEDWTSAEEAPAETEAGDDDTAANRDKNEGAEAPPHALVALDATAPRRPRQRNGATRSLYFILLRQLEELLALIAVFVDGSEGVASHLSTPATILQLMQVLEAATTTTWDALLHPTAQYYSDEVAVQEAAKLLPETIIAMRMYKRREASLLASLAVHVADLLLLLSSENIVMAAVLLGTSGAAGDCINAEQQAFLNKIVDASDLVSWLSTKTSVDVALATSTAAPPLSMVAIDRETTLHLLLRATLAIQGMLIRLAPSAANLQRVMGPLCTALQTMAPPIHRWRCSVLPLLLESCPLPEDERVSMLHLQHQELRSTQSTIRLLLAVVDAICEENRPGGDHHPHPLSSSSDENDEAAFALNPLAGLLRDGPVFYLFGLLLKDMLWMPAHRDAGAPTAEEAATGTTSIQYRDGLGRGDIMSLAEQQRALRVAADGNAEATALQLLIHAIEVNVWEVANILLLMLDAGCLGDPSRIWRSFVDAVQMRHQLLVEAASASAGSNALTAGGAPQLIWLQVESLTQMLWTMQRKQGRRGGGAAAAANDVQASAADVDVLTRVAWEAGGSAALRQACVGAVALLCASLHAAEATAAAARFALAVLQQGCGAGQSTDSSTLLQLEQGIVQSVAPPTDVKERVGWCSRLAAADAVVSLRCEAANALMDLFLDEQHDIAVYRPLGVQAVLHQFLPLLRGYLKRRRQLSKESMRRYRLALPVIRGDEEQWAEVEENLSGFLDYKASHQN